MRSILDLHYLMKWNRNNVDLHELPEATKNFLVDEGIDAFSLLYHAEFCECFLFESDKYCIGSISQAAIIIDTDGKIYLHDEFANLTPLASSVSHFVKLNLRLQNVSFDEPVDWEKLIGELVEIDEVFLISPFWNDLVHYLNQF